MGPSMQYEILGSAWYTPPVVNLMDDHLFGTTKQLGMSIGVVAIKSGSEGHWKAYIGFGIHGDDQKADEQHIAANGMPLGDKHVACAYFPELPVKGYTQ
jgi:hypothetical protein